MTGWTPLYQQIVGSSVWGAPDHVRLAWITLLAVANKQGVAVITEGGLARLAVISRENAADALKVLSSPDTDTLTQENEGRRIERVADGWKLLNFRKYRELAKSQAVREANAEAQARWRASQKAENSPENVEVSTGNNGKPDDMEKAIKSYHADARTALHVLNELSGKHFRETDTNLATISMRLNEDGVDLDGIKLMIGRQCKRWKGTAQAEYLRPETLFGKTKFDSYYAARDEQIYDETNDRNRKRGFDRNAGTANAGRTEQYDMAKIQAARELREQQSRASEDAGCGEQIRGES